MTNQDIELTKKLPRNFGVAPLFRLRWRFEFHDGRAPKYGIWNGASGRKEDSAAFVDKTNLLWAIVEGEKVGAWTVKEFFRVSGADYFHAKWDGAVLAPAFVKESYKAAPNIIGLTMLTRNNAYTALVNGKVLQRKITQDERSIRLAEHSVGG